MVSPSRGAEMNSYKHEKSLSCQLCITFYIYTIPDIESHIWYRYDPNLDPNEDILSNFIAETHE